ncbi:MAG: ThuA domain-containing protein [Acidobacteria bacterium]|nr:ThuA domain-containing protein [Acidobacteriota bacterium]
MKLRSVTCWLVLLATGAYGWATPPEDAEQGPLHLLVVTGGHDYPTSFYTLFESPGEFQWDHAPSNHEAFRSDLRGKYEVLVLYDSSREISEGEKRNLTDFVRSGAGMVVLHHAILDYPDWEWWWRDVVGGKYLLKPENGKPGSTYLHDQEISVEPVGKHPILTGLGPMRINDETYKGMWISPKVQVILKTNHPTSDGPVAWVSPFKDSRVVYIQLGHGELAHRNAGYRRLVHNAILWAGNRLGP